jgi:small subunit ribosomal protein S17
MDKIQATRQGVVVSRSSDKTIAVLVESRKTHFTGKVIKTHRKYIVHDPENLAKIDNVVIIKEGRKVSKSKSWHLSKILSNEGVQ